MNSNPFMVVTGGHVFAPEDLGQKELLIWGGKIVEVGDRLREKVASFADVQVVDASNKFVVPGFIDQHIHFLGGGDFEGPLGRVPELHVGWITAGGVTTAVGIIGIDMEFKGLHGLLVKANELDRSGLSTYIYTGSFRLPSPYLTSSVRADIVLIDKIVGVKVALSEDTYPNLSLEKLTEVAGQVQLAAGITGKAAVIHAHIGRNRKRLQPLFDLLKHVDIPPSQIVPTHVNRTEPDTLEHAIEFAKMGGTIDFSANLSKRSGSRTGIDPADAASRALASDVPLSQITISSDSNVSMPLLNERREVVGLHNAPPTILHREWVETVRRNDLTLSQALPLVTTNVARVLKIDDRKGSLEPDKDADVVLLTKDLEVDTVLARGRVMVRSGQVVVKGPFEEREPFEAYTRSDG